MELDPPAISRRIAQARKQAGFSQHQLAAQMGVHWRSIQNWERPDQSVPWDRLSEIGRITGTRVEWLLGAPTGEGLEADEASRLREEMRSLREELLRELDAQRREVARAVLASVQEALGVQATSVDLPSHADLIE
ncbi:MAG: helix-turn-helix domain-containing protein [Actinomycetota bacterium]